MSQMRYAVGQPNPQKCDAVEIYRDTLRKKRLSRIFKSVLDRVGALILLVLLSPLIAAIAAAVCIDSPGGAIFSQTRLTEGMRSFKMYKFRTMRTQENGCGLTLSNDERITRAGRFLRRTRLDELPQLVNIILGDMSFVGPRPEVCRYADCYDEEMRAVFLVKAGVTSRTSMMFVDEAELLTGMNAERIYRDIILPRKVGEQLRELLKFSLFEDIKTLFLTLLFPVVACLDEKNLKRYNRFGFFSFDFPKIAEK